jgi:Uncharacterized protein conserved in bacteria (DUF2066)
MTLPMVSATAGARRGYPLLVLVVLLLAALARPAPLRADEADFSATVKVDATADTAEKARDLARLDGQRRALTEVVTRLSGAADAARIAKLDDKAITDMVESLDVADEQMSAVHYDADYTFHFAAAKVRPLLQAAGAPPEAGPEPVASAGGKPFVILPVYREGGRVVLWDDPNPWRDAWSQAPTITTPVPLAVPLGDIGDVAAIDAQGALDGKAEALAAIAQRNGGEDAIVVVATARQQDGQLAGIDVAIKRYHLGQPAGGGNASVAAKPGEAASDFFKRAVAAVAAAIERGPAAPVAAVAAGGAPASLTAIVPLDSLTDWIEVQRRLSSLEGVKKVDLLWLTRREARIEIHYLGSADQLKASLAAANLDLSGGDPQWRLRRGGAASLR